MSIRYATPSPARHDPDGALDEAHVPVGLGSGGYLGWVVRAEHPHRIDLHQRAHQGEDAEDDEEEAAGLGRVDREDRVADHVVLGAAGARVLGVLVVDDQSQVRGDQSQQQRRKQQDVQHVEPGDDEVAGELAAEDEELGPGADQRGRPDRTVDEPQAGARQQVVRQRVAREALEGADHQQVTPISQLISRGLRNAPVKKIRRLWVSIAATKSIAAQWCICRSSRPPRMSKERPRVDS